MNKIAKDPARLVRFLIGIGIGVYSIIDREYFLLILAGLFIFQSIVGVSCCGASCFGGGCDSVDDSTDDKTVYRGQIKEYEPEK